MRLRASAKTEILAKAEELRKASPALSAEQAFARVYTDPAKVKLKKRCDAVEQKKRVEAMSATSQEPWAVYPSFGVMSYWHEALDALQRSTDKRDSRAATLLQGSLAERAAALLEIFETNADRPAERWPIRPLIAKAMTIELTAAFSAQGVPMTGAILELLCRCMDVPANFLRDPSAILEGRDGKGQGADPSVKDGAEILDAQHFQRTGNYMTISALAKAVGAARSSIREWARGWRTNPDDEKV